MELLKILKFIYQHPLNVNNRFKAIIRFLFWQINTKINPYPIIYSFTEHSKLIVRKGMKGATGNLYCGLMEYYDMGFLLHFLREDDLFVDIGANIGAYTILASSEIQAKTLSIEPIPDTFKILNENIKINNINNKVTALNIGLAGNKSELFFTDTLDTVNHVSTNSETNTIKVPVQTLDDLLYGADIPILLKIDVEGYEWEVLRGAGNVLKNQELKVIIIELNGSGYRYGFQDAAIHQKLLNCGYSPYAYDPMTRNLTELVSYGTQNTIYIRDFEYVSKRVKSARKILIGIDRIEM